MQHGHGNAAWPWPRTTDNDLHHGNGHEPWTWTCNIDMSKLMDMDIQYGHGHTVQHKHWHTAWTRIRLTPRAEKSLQVKVWIFVFAKSSTLPRESCILWGPPRTLLPLTTRAEGCTCSINQSSTFYKMKFFLVCLGSCESMNSLALTVQSSNRSGGRSRAEYER